nr:hypothetical protein GCM10020241_33850 [Streptoalloteichus tenebrarius]
MEFIRPFEPTTITSAQTEKTSTGHGRRILIPTTTSATAARRNPTVATSSTDRAEASASRPNFQVAAPPSKRDAHPRSCNAKYPSHRPVRTPTQAR